MLSGDDDPVAAVKKLADSGISLIVTDLPADSLLKVADAGRERGLVLFNSGAIDDRNARRLQNKCYSCCALTCHACGREERYLALNLHKSRVSMARATGLFEFALLDDVSAETIRRTAQCIGKELVRLVGADNE
jgi:hypothetical protein